ncbi:Uncharacterised protein [Acinetobacter baumannii]|nr:Uncharacterised protein [Acinetobacter baumannii]
MRIARQRELRQPRQHLIRRRMPIPERGEPGRQRALAVAEQRIGHPGQTHRDPVQPVQQLIDARLRTLQRRIVARQPGLIGAQEGISRQRDRPVRPKDHEPEQRCQVITEVDPQQRVLQLAQAQLFTAIHRQTVDQGQLFRHLIAGMGIPLPRRFQVSAIVFALDAGADAQQIDDDPQQQRHHAEE